ncbi:P22 phage major capsid protein family protein [Actinomadura rudentiformis]|uniref:P22 coat protein-protein 5 domain protein n=1 Tax=Actinomadura rudentiformis TaxID=359158 RepID=A0A6H9YGQ4_9ACTN|nr:P22 phage major capsid protein family protein [Actinomadura rudentiformis]KAB2344874.1 P22 coat protein - protein 5 domain protein [Actinomadura rudentiformis]
MAITRFRAEVWSALLATSLKKAHVYAALCNSDYEGEIAAAGDTVRITSISRPTIRTYGRNADIQYEELTDAQRTLVVDQEKYWAFSIDDLDAAQARGNVVPEAMSEAAHGLADVADTYVANLYTQAQAANVIPARTISSGDAAYESLVDLGVKLGEANVPNAGRWVVIPEWYHGQLLKSPNFINAEKAADGGAALRRGFIGQAAGFDIFKSNNAPNPAAADYVVMAGVRAAITYADQVNRTEALRSEARFGDRVRGLYNYGAKVIRPDALAVLTATRPA